MEQRLGSWCTLCISLSDARSWCEQKLHTTFPHFLHFCGVLASWHCWQGGLVAVELFVGLEGLVEWFYHRPFFFSFNISTLGSFVWVLDIESGCCCFMCLIRVLVWQNNKPIEFYHHLRSCVAILCSLRFTHFWVKFGL